MLSNAAGYSRKCYEANLGADGCTFFWNQSITFMEKRDSTCPFPGGTCALDEDPALVLDTGYIHAKYLGINSEIPYHFRRTTICAPLKPNGDILSVEMNRNNTRDSFIDSVSNFYGVQKSFSITTEEMDVTIIELVCR